MSVREERRENGHLKTPFRVATKGDQMLDETRVENQPLTIVENAPLDSSRDEPLAFHEAAHAVALWKLGLGIRSISIDPNEGTSGHTMPARAYDLEAERDPR